MCSPIVCRDNNTLAYRKCTIQLVEKDYFDSFFFVFVFGQFHSGIKLISFQKHSLIINDSMQQLKMLSFPAFLLLLKQFSLSDKDLHRTLS